MNAHSLLAKTAKAQAKKPYHGFVPGLTSNLEPIRLPENLHFIDGKA